MSTRHPFQVGIAYRSAEEAFKDANYATPIWRCETEWDRTKDYFVWGVMISGILGALYIVWAVSTR